MKSTSAKPTATATPTATAKPTTTIVLQKDKECKGSIRFQSADPQAVLTNAYVARSMPGLANATAVRITIELI